MTEREALKLALEALEVATTPLAKDRQEVLRAIIAIREALAQPEQEHAEQMAKLGWQYFECPACGSEGAKAFPKPEQEPVIDKSAAIRIATSLGWEPKRTWIGLTDEEKNAITWGNDIYKILELAEAKLKEKNNV